MGELTNSQLVVIRKALDIGFASWDGDGWYANQAGYGYDEAEETLRDAGNIVNALLQDSAPSGPEEGAG